jgi:hypothetical protein
MADAVFPSGRGSLSGSCLLALGALGGQATTAEVRLYLKRNGNRLLPPQVRGGLNNLALRRKPPLAEVVQRGQAGYGQSNLWRLTDAGREFLAAENGTDVRFLCGTGWPQDRTGR